MKLSAILAPLVAAGVDAETLLKTVRAYEEQQESEIEKRREADRIRQRRHRGHVTSRDVTVTERDTPPSDKEISPTPPKEINSPRETPSARGTRLPKDWALPASWGKWALNEGHSEATIRFEADKFRDFWLSKSGKDATKVDWERTWHNWMRSVGQPRAQHQAQPPPRPKSEFRQHQDNVQRELDKALGRKRDDEFTGQTFDLAAGDWRTH